VSVSDDHRIRVRIYLEDTDAGGIAYHASYLRFMERARTEWLRAAGMEQSNTFDEDLSFVVYAMELKFLRAAKLDEEVVVTCELQKVGAASLEVVQRVFVEASGDDCVKAQVKVACIRLSTGKPRRIPNELRARVR